LIWRDQTERNGRILRRDPPHLKASTFFDGDADGPDASGFCFGIEFQNERLLAAIRCCHGDHFSVWALVIVLASR